MDTSKTIRGLVGSGAVAALIAALAQFSTFEDFLLWAITAAGGGVVVWGLIELWDAAAARAGRTVNPDLKMYGAQILAFLLPVGGNFAAWRMGLITLDYTHVVGMIAVVYQVSQTIHWEATSEPHKAEHPPDDGAGSGGGGTPKVDMAERLRLAEYETVKPKPPASAPAPTKPVEPKAEYINGAIGTYAVGAFTVALMLIVGLLVLASCSGFGAADNTPTPVGPTKVVTRIVTAVVTVPVPITTAVPTGIPTGAATVPVPISTTVPTAVSTAPPAPVPTK